MAQDNKQIDESQYSRQIFVLGKKAMQAMQNSNILISGMNGVGVEIAKDVILAGVNSVTVHDTKLTTNFDLGTQFYLTEEDIGKNRVECVHKLAELNSHVKVTATTDDLINILSTSSFTVAVFTDLRTLEEQIMINKLTRERNIKCIIANTYGGFANIFCDFGNNFLVEDTDGEEAKTGVITSITETDKGFVITTAEAHNLTSDDVIRIQFANKETDSGTNNVPDIKVKKFVDRCSFLVDSSTKLSTGTMSNTTLNQVKQTKVLNFKPLSEAIENPEIVTTNVHDFSLPTTLHAIFRALSGFESKHGKYPELWNDDDANELYTLTSAIFPDVKKDTVINISHTLRGQLCPITGFIGGICAQEVMKACSGKFHPIFQWLYYDITEILVELAKSKPVIDLTKSTRYDSQRFVFGDEYQKKLEAANIFIVGSGAIGCEHLKNFALMGIGNMIITDMDTIEKSNLNRQFLFRNSDIGKPKSTTAAEAIMKINPHIKVIAQQNFVGVETLNIYDETFFQKLTCVTNALDNVKARLFVDSLCIANSKPLLESGTLGTKGNIQTVIPYLTESYGSTVDPPEKEVPVCTLKNFPYLIDHTIQWARDFFAGIFEQMPANAVKYLKDKESIRTLSPTELIDVVANIKQICENYPRSYRDCINYGYKTWHKMFRDDIQQLIHKFPADTKTSEGVPFWTGTKKCPKPMSFDANSEFDVQFVTTFANLWANVFSVQIENDQSITDYMKSLTPPTFVPSDDVKISASEEEEKERVKANTVDVSNIHIDDIIKNLPQLENKDLDKIMSLSFEKDDDTNFHIDFIAATANLRGANYGIPQADRHKIKGIAGKIIPAIATTTALVSGLVSVELYKVLLELKNIESYRSVFANLALPYFGFSEPAAVKKSKIKDLEFSMWDSLKFNNMTVANLMKNITEKYKLTVSSITVGSMILYSDFQSEGAKRNKLNKLITDVYTDIGKNQPQSPLLINILVTDSDDEGTDKEGDEYDLPLCKIYF